MATVKVKFVNHSKNLINYVVRGMGANDVKDGRHCMVDSAALEFEKLRQIHQSKGNIEALHVIQSFSKSDAMFCNPEAANDLGVKLAESYFKGHQFIVVTHSHQAHLHNHIIVNPVNMETGKKIENKKHHLYKLRSISDGHCRERGLSVVRGRDKSETPELHADLHQMKRFKSMSYILDLKDKADFARSFATNFEAYGEALGAFDIQLRVTDKTITYFYPGHERGKRGSKIGRAYDKSGLEEVFNQNQERIQKSLGNDPNSKLNPASFLRSKLSQELSNDQASYQGHVKRLRNERSGKAPEEFNNPLLMEEIKRAKGRSIVDYCRDNKLSLAAGGDGGFTVKGKEFVRIKGNSWTNTKNDTQGTIIEFVAAHKQCSIIHAVAILNDNPSLDRLEPFLGQRKRNYHSFHLPKEKVASGPDSMSTLTRFAKKLDFALSHVTSGNHKVDVSKDGSVWLYAGKSGHSAIEFFEEKDGNWKHRVHGDGIDPFHEFKNKLKRELFLFNSPIDFFRFKDKNPTFDHSKQNVLVLRQSGDPALGMFLLLSDFIKSLFVVHQDGADHRKRSQDLISFYRQQFRGRDFLFNTKSIGPQINRGMSLDI